MSDAVLGSRVIIMYEPPDMVPASNFSILPLSLFGNEADQRVEHSDEVAPKELHMIQARAVVW